MHTILSQARTQDWMKGLSSSTGRRAENDAESVVGGGGGGGWRGGGGCPHSTIWEKNEIWKQLDDIWCHLKLTIVIISTVSCWYNRLLDNYLIGRVLAHIKKDHMTISTIFVIKYRTTENWKTINQWQGFIELLYKCWFYMYNISVRLLEYFINIFTMKPN